MLKGSRLWVSQPEIYMFFLQAGCECVLSDSLTLDLLDYIDCKGQKDVQKAQKAHVFNLPENKPQEWSPIRCGELVPRVPSLTFVCADSKVRSRLHSRKPHRQWRFCSSPVLPNV